MSRTQPAIAAATTTMITATNSFGSQAMTSAISVADRIRAEDAEGQLQHEQQEREHHQPGGEVGGAVLAEHPVEAAPRHGPVEPDPLQAGADPAPDPPRDQPAQQHDREEDQHLDRDVQRRCSSRSVNSSPISAAKIILTRLLISSSVGDKTSQVRRIVPARPRALLPGSCCLGRERRHQLPGSCGGVCRRAVETPSLGQT